MTAMNAPPLKLKRIPPLTWRRGKVMLANVANPRATTRPASALLLEVVIEKAATARKLAPMKVQAETFNRPCRSQLRVSVLAARPMSINSKSPTRWME